MQHHETLSSMSEVEHTVSALRNLHPQFPQLTMPLGVSDIRHTQSYAKFFQRVKSVNNLGLMFLRQTEDELPNRAVALFIFKKRRLSRT